MFTDAYSNQSTFNKNKNKKTAGSWTPPSKRNMHVTIAGSLAKDAIDPSTRA